MIYVEDELDALASERWAFEEHMHVMEEQELDWCASNDLDTEWYEEVWEDSWAEEQ